MSQNRFNPLFRALPSFTDLAFIVPIVILLAAPHGVGEMIGDGDTGWHIRSGDWILAHLEVPHQDIFSYTKSGQSWFAWEWLWDVCFARIHSSWGLSGVVLSSILVICLTSALLYRLLVRVTAREGLENPLLAIIVTGVAMGGASLHWLARPHLFTMLFIVLFMTILERASALERSSLEQSGGQPTSLRLLWILPPLTILWTNLHGGFIVGILLVATYAAGPLLRAAMEPDAEMRAVRARSSLPYLAATAGCALASLVNPYTYHLHQHIYKYLGDPFTMNYINEFLPTNFRFVQSRLLELMLLLAVGAAFWYGRRMRFAEVLVLAGTAHMALTVARNVPIFMLVAAPLVARPLVHWLRAAAAAPVAAWLRTLAATVEEIGQELVPLERPWRVHAASAAALALIAALMAVPAAGVKFRPGYDPHRFPESALSQLRAPGHRIFTDDSWGGYLIYALAPQGTKVYVDGRSDFYGDKFDEEFLSVMNVKYDWEETLGRYGVDTILLPAAAPLAGAIKESRHWRVSYDDGLALVFRPAENAAPNTSQDSAAISGGLGRRDLQVTSAAGVYPQDHVFQTTKKGMTP